MAGPCQLAACHEHKRCPQALQHQRPHPRNPGSCLIQRPRSPRPAGTPAPAVPIRVAFFNMDLCNAPPALQDFKRLRYHLYEGPYRLKPYWAAASYGRIRFDESTSVLVNIKVPCDDPKFSAGACNVDDWKDYVRANQQALLGSNAFDSFKFKVCKAAAALHTKALDIRSCSVSACFDVLAVSWDSLYSGTAWKLATNTGTTGCSLSLMQVWITPETQECIDEGFAWAAGDTAFIRSVGTTEDSAIIKVSARRVESSGWGLRLVSLTATAEQH